jgi:small subunit ribosomal protein S1
MEGSEERPVAREERDPAASEVPGNAPGPDAAETPSTDFGSLLARSSVPKEAEVKVGDRVRGRIVSIGEVDAFVDYGGRSEASITSTELIGEDGQPRYRIGDEIEAIVASIEDGVLLTLSGRAVALSGEMLREAYENKVPVEGLVKQIIRGGYEVTVSGVRGFCPMSQIDARFVEDPHEFVGQKLSFRIIEWREGGRNLVLSRRAVVEEQAERLRSELKSRLTEGMELEGVVKRVQPFGLFVDLGGVEGLVHVSELSHGRIDNPADYFAAGQKLRVKILKVENLDGPKERISLSVRQLLPDPWESDIGRFHEGDRVKGRVVSLAAFGAFVELAPGLDGLIHVSEISHRRVGHPKEVLEAGQEVEVEIKEVDRNRRRISLSMKSLEEVEATPAGAGPKVGDAIEGVVSGVKPFGVFVDIASPGARLSGLIPVSETGESRDVNLFKKFPKGRPIRAQIVHIDEQGRIRLSLTAIKENQERAGYESYKTGAKAPSAGTSLSIFADVLEKVKRRSEEEGRNPRE